MKPKNLDVLRRALEDLPDGPIPAEEDPRIGGLLEAAWDELEGGDAEGMTADKLLARTEELTWQPPNLSFTIERHGGTVQGSTRAELHRYEVNVETGSLRLGTGGFRQVVPRDKPVRVEPLVDEIVRAIQLNQKHPALEWRTSTQVRVIPSRIEGLKSGYKQTVAGRRKRFIVALDQQLATFGWSRMPVEKRFEYKRAG